MGHECHTIRLPVRRGRLGPSVVLRQGPDGLETHAQRRCGGVQFSREFQFLLDAFAGAQVSGELRRDGNEEAALGPDDGSAPSHQRLLHGSVNASPH